MHRFAIVFAFTVLTTAMLLLNGCTAYNVAVEERTAGQYIDDGNIALTIEKEFLADDQVKYLDFDAFCYRGHVYVIGEYESRGQIDRAVKLAKDVEGVRQVTTYLLPKKEDPGCSTMDAIEMHQKLKQKLVGDKNIWSTNINIEVLQCNIVLLGIVGSQAEKAAAEAHAKSVPGVRGVKSFLTVN